MTILIIPHEDLEQRPLLDTLARHDMAYRVVRDPVEAVAQLARSGAGPAGDGPDQGAIPDAIPDMGDSVLLLSERLFQDKGRELSAALRKKPDLCDIPIVVAVSSDRSDHLLHQKYQNSVYWFHQPFREITLLSILTSALNDSRHRRDLRREIRSRDRIFGFIKSGVFRIRSFDQAEKLATMLSLACPDPDRIALGLLELLINGIEHGNLGLSFDDKRRLIQEGRLKTEIERRLALPENRDKFVEIAFELGDNLASFRITDQGSGFDVDKFHRTPMDQNFLPSGRGMALARSTSFDYMEYLGCGNMVLAIAYFKADRSD